MKLPLPVAEYNTEIPMRKYTRNRHSWTGPRPGDFPLGSVESRAATRAVQLAHDMAARERWAVLLGNLTPREKEFMEGTESPGTEFGLLMVRTIVRKCELFGWPLPTPEKSASRSPSLETD